MIETIIYQLLDGITMGVVYVLIAAGLSVIFGVMKVINFAHGELLALGAYFALAIIAPIGEIGFFVALITAPILVGVAGALLERFTVRPLYGRDPLYHILLTFGLVLVINDLIYIIWGPETTALSRPDIISGTLTIGGLSISQYNLFVIAVGALVIFGILSVLKYTKYGLIIRAGVQDRQMVRNLGIDIDRYYSIVFGAGAALAAVGGIMIGGRQQVNPEIGMSIIIPAFVIVVIGGLGSFKGAAVAGLLIGILQESVIRPYFEFLEGMIIFVLMIAILLLRPKGLFGSEFEEGHSGGTDGLLVGSQGGILDPDTRLKLGLSMVVLLGLVPFMSGILLTEYAETLLVRILIWGLFALSLDFVMGYTGLVSLGHALFLGVGAYAVGGTLYHGVVSSVIPALVFAFVSAGLIAWFVGYLSIRVHGVYFAMITLAFAEVYYNLLYQVDSWFNTEITGRDEGLFGYRAHYGIGDIGGELHEIAPTIGPFDLSDTSMLLYIILFILVSSYFVLRRTLKSPFGTVLKAIRENEQRATFIGYNTTKYKRRAFTISGAFGGLAGGLFALDQGAVFPSVAEWMNSGEVIVMTILGGMGTLYGPILGAFAFFGLEQFLEGFTRRWRIFLGALFVLFVIFLPKGLISLPAKVQSQINNWRSQTGTESDQSPTGGDD